MSAQMWSADNLASMQASELQGMLRSFGLPADGSHDDLVRRALDFQGKNANMNATSSANFDGNADPQNPPRTPVQAPDTALRAAPKSRPSGAYEQNAPASSCVYFPGSDSVV